jgi:hypothetical protein
MTPEMTEYFRLVAECDQAEALCTELEALSLASADRCLVPGYMPTSADWAVSERFLEAVEAYRALSDRIITAVNNLSRSRA